MNPETSTARFSRISEKRRALFDLLLKQSKGPSPDGPPLVRAATSGPRKLSFAQERLWLLNQLQPTSAFYNCPMRVLLRGVLDIDALRRSVVEIVHRHAVLRSRVVVVDGSPVQQVTDAQAQLPVMDLAGLGAVERATELERFAGDEMQRPFDLSKGPLLRTTLVQLSQQEHVLLITMHHIVTDWWSFGIFLGEFTTLYRAFSSGKPSPLPPLPIEYADFAEWQRGWLQGPVLEEQLGYWKRQLAGMPVLPLATDRPQPPVQSFRGAEQRLTLSKQVSTGLKELGRQEGATFFMVLLAAFDALLHRLTGQEDIGVLSAVANRNRSEIQGLIGFFVNALVMRTSLSGDPTFRELVRRVRETALGAYAHQDLPFEKLVDELRPERNAGGNPLAQLMFVLQNAPSAAADLPGLSLLPWEVSTTRFDLEVHLWETGEATEGRFVYSTDLFDGQTIERLAAQYRVLLEAAVADPDQRVSQLRMIDEVEQHRLQVEWNSTRREYARESCIHQLFEAQAEQAADEVAVVFEGQQLTYGQLNRRANQLAHYLRKRGVGPDVLVGICMQRSLELVVGLLAILKAGGAYVPLDPDYPPQRLAFMLEDAQVGVLLTQERLKESLPQHRAELVYVDADEAAIGEESPADPENRATPENLAYVMYTSGSTGTPKGVCIVHRGVVRLVNNPDYADLNRDEVFLQLASISFDAATFEIWGALLNGARLVIFPPHPPSLEELAAFLQHHKVSTLWLTANLFHVMVNENLAGLRPVRQLLAGGDKLSPVHVKRALGELKGCRLINGYGPTENTTFTCCHPIADPDLVGASVSIGRPISNTQVYLLDKNMHLIPVGVIGELYAGGDGLARGYWRRPELTAEKFIPNPFSDVPGDRLYKTGDLARYWPNGTIEFVGRLDHQVKIRGFRIELGEIEAVLSQSPGVLQCVVTAQESKSGEKRLVAYVVANPQGPAPAPGPLRASLKQKLPEYMVPGIFVTLENLPLTPNGKVDRQALPLPSADDLELGADPVMPRNETEKTLAQIWCQVLGLRRVGIHDNFFELGGDSIIAIQIASRAKQAGIRLTPMQTFRHRTIAELAAAAGSSQVIESEQGLVTGPVPLTPIQEWFFEQDRPEPQHWNQAILLEVAANADATLLDRAIERLVEHHDALRLRFTRGGTAWTQSNDGTGWAPHFSVHDLSKLKEPEQRSTLESTAGQIQASLNLSDGPLFRAVFFNMGSECPGRLFMVAHHLVIDAVSWRILLEDLQLAYQHLREAEAIRLPAKTTSFRDWATKLCEYARSSQPEKELTYWLGCAWSKVGRLPVDCADGENDEASARSLTVSLSRDETQALLQKVPEAYQTHVEEVLLAALAQVLSKWGGAPAVLMDVEGHGRREEVIPGVDLSRTVGWFTAVFPVVLEATWHSPGETLKAVKEQFRAIPNWGIGYGILRYLCDGALSRPLRDLPRPEISFNYLGQLDQVLSSSLLFSAAESSGSHRNPKQKRWYLLDVNGMVRDGKLQLSWNYSENVHRPETMKALAHECMAALRSLIEHCQSPGAGGYTLSDFPLARMIELTPEDLELISASASRTASC